MHRKKKRRINFRLFFFHFIRFYWLLFDVPELLLDPVPELFIDILPLRDILPFDIFEFIEEPPLLIDELFDIDEFPIEELFDIEVFPPIEELFDIEVFPPIDEFPFVIVVELFDIILEFVRFVFVFVSPVQAPKIAVETTKLLIAINFFILFFWSSPCFFCVIQRRIR